MIDRNFIAQEILNEVVKYIGETETDGKNRSILIDSINKSMGVPLGSPYCMGFLWVCVNRVCARFSFKNPLPKLAGTQVMLSRINKKYCRSKGQVGDFSFWQSRFDSNKGHVGILAIDQDPGSDDFLGYEANTDRAGSRDGDGIWEKWRSVKGSSSLKFQTFVDVPQMVLDRLTASADQESPQ